MKKILSLILMMTTLLSVMFVFSGCETGLVSTVTANDAKAQTLVIAAIKDEKTTNEAIAAVQNALNEITESKFNTHVILRLFTAEEYAAQILGMSQRLEAEQQKYESSSNSSGGGKKDNIVSDDRYDLIDSNEKNQYTVEANGDLTYKDEFGRPVTVYPKVSDDQIDLVFIDSLRTYYNLVDKKYVIPLNDDYAAKPDLGKYITTSFLSQMGKVADGKENAGNIYAIPNNYVARDYDYILVNKKLYDYYCYDIHCDVNPLDKDDTSGCNDLTDFEYFLQDVAKNNATVAEELRVDKILYNYTGTQWESFYGNGDGIGTALVFPSTRRQFNYSGTRFTVDSIFAKGLFKKTQSILYSMRTEYANAPYEGECFFMSTEEEVGYKVPAANMADNAETFALAMVSGDSSVAEYYNQDDYYVVKIGTPIADNQLFSSMFAVSTFSSTGVDSNGIRVPEKIENYEELRNPRCFEIISMLQTDTDVVNLLTYGVQGINYDVYDNDEKAYNIGKNGYFPVLGKMGNTFLARPNDQMDSKTAFYAANSWQAARAQNRYAIAAPFCGMLLRDFEEEGVAYVSSQLDSFFTEFYATSMEKINNFKGTDDNGKPITIEKYIDSINSELRKTDQYKLAMQEYKEIDEETGYTGPSYVGLPLPQATYFFYFITSGTGVYR